MSVFGPVVDILGNSSNLRTSTAIAIAGETTVYSEQFEITGIKELVLCYKATGTNVRLKITLQQSYNTTAANFVVPSGIDDVVTQLEDETQHYVQLVPVALQYCRLCIEGLDGNGANSTIDCRLSKIEER